MKMFVETDMEGVAGIINVEDYLSPSGRYHEKARRLVTEEVNAAVRGFADAGFDDVIVADGHGSGAMDIELLDRRARMMRGRMGWPSVLDASFDALAFVGQHPKAGTPYAHIPHTQWFGIIDMSINGISIGEYGQTVLCGNELDVPIIFASGDAAFCREAKELTPWVETVAGKEGTLGGKGDELERDAYGRSHIAAIHRHPEVVRQEIEEVARRAAGRFIEDPSSFGRIDIQPPYKLVVRYRQVGDKPPHTEEREHPTSIIDLLNSQ